MNGLAGHGIVHVYSCRELHHSVDTNGDEEK